MESMGLEVWDWRLTSYLLWTMFNGFRERIPDQTSGPCDSSSGGEFYSPANPNTLVRHIDLPSINFTFFLHSHPRLCASYGPPSHNSPHSRPSSHRRKCPPKQRTRKRTTVPPGTTSRLSECSTTSSRRQPPGRSGTPRSTPRPSTLASSLVRSEAIPGRTSAPDLGYPQC